MLTRTAFGPKLFPRRLLSKTQWFCNGFEGCGCILDALPLSLPLQLALQGLRRAAGAWGQTFRRAQHTSLGVQSSPAYQKTIAKPLPFTHEPLRKRFPAQNCLCWHFEISILSLCLPSTCTLSIGCLEPKSPDTNPPEPKSRDPPPHPPVR